jgi:DNA-binding CsgD family transcriptional regulator
LAQGAPPGEQRITPRERDILARVAVGETVKESAAALGISPKTVEAHRQHLREKLELTSAAALTRFAVERTRDDGRRPAAADSPPSASGHPLGTHRR